MALSTFTVLTVFSVLFDLVGVPDLPTVSEISTFSNRLNGFRRLDIVLGADCHDAVRRLGDFGLDGTVGFFGVLMDVGRLPIDWFDLDRGLAILALPLFCFLRRP
jgi:hypothetical protein